MKTISIVNHKGGVGKTTTAFNFAAELSRRGKRVLLIDFDMQGNLSSAVGIKDDERNGYSIADLMQAAIDGNNGKVENADIRIFAPGFYQSGELLNIIPCNLKMANVKINLISTMARECFLQMVLSTVEREAAKHGRFYDYCIIDCAPSIDIDFQNALVASDEILIIAEADTFSTDGMTSLLNEFRKVKSFFNSNLKIAGVLINNVDNRTVFTREMVGHIKDFWKGLNVFETVIPSSIRVKEAILSHLPMCEYEPSNLSAIAYSEFTDEYLRGETNA